MTAGRTHRAVQHRIEIVGIEAVSLVSDRRFSRHAHDQLGIGVIAAGAQRSWSGIGPVEATAGDVITVNPGEMHDGEPLGRSMRAWRMLYLAPDLVTRTVAEEICSPVEIARPAVRDPVLAGRFARLFAALTTSSPDALAIEQELLRTLMHVLAQHGSRPAPPRTPPPFVAKAVRRLDEAPALPVTLAELAALAGVSRFQLLRGFSREVGTTPHAYLLQQRVRLARRLLAAGRSPAEAAAEAGFADQSHLNRVFVRQLGVTPARYRAALL